jgi:hypothetical protein
VGSRRRQQPQAAWPGRWSIAIAVGALVIAAAVWWHGARAPLEAAGASTASLSPSALVTGAAGARPAGAARVAELPPPPIAPYPAGGVAGISTDDPVTAYRKANVYPPTSRPLTKDQLDLLQPNRRHELLRPTDHGDGVSFLFTADRYFAIGDDTLTATLDVRRDGVPIPATITKAYAVVADPVGHVEPPIEMAYAAAAGGGLASVFAPAKLALRRQSTISLYVEFDYGSASQLGHFDFQYTPDRGIPARFTGAFTEALDAGSLVVHAGLEVTSPGHYVIDGNLFDAANQPVAWSRFKGELSAGNQNADLVFFGKVIVDAGAKGPFHLGQLRGARYAPDQDPDLEQVPPFAGSYVTKPYATEQFSDAEYDSAEKQRMLQLLGNDPTHRGGAGRGPT